MYICYQILVDINIFPFGKYSVDQFASIKMLTDLTYLQKILDQTKWTVIANLPFTVLVHW